MRQSLREGRIPFDISLNQPNSETSATMLVSEIRKLYQENKLVSDLGYFIESCI